MTFSLFNPIYVSTNAFGISSVLTPLFYFISTNTAVMIVSDAVIGIVAFSCDMYACGVIPFEHILDLMISSIFCVGKSDFILLCFFQNSSFH